MERLLIPAEECDEVLDGPGVALPRDEGRSVDPTLVDGELRQQAIIGGVLGAE
jgi:hypothetical protein